MRVFGAVAFASFIGLSILAFAQATTPGQPTTAQPGQTSSTPQRMQARPLRPGETPPKGTGVMKGQVMASTGTPRFEIKELAAGRYNISATKGGFIAGQFGQRRPGDPGTPIDLSDGQTAEKVNFTLSRGSVISGKPEFLARAKEESKTFSLKEGETKAFDVKLSKLVP